MRTVTITIAGIVFDVPLDLASVTGYTVTTDAEGNPSANIRDVYSPKQYLLRAMSEGLTGNAVFLRAVALRAIEYDKIQRAAAALKVEETRLQAAHVERQAQVLACRVKGLSEAV